MAMAKAKDMAMAMAKAMAKAMSLAMIKEPFSESRTLFRII